MSHAQEKNREYIQKLRGLLRDLPGFAAEFMRGIEPTTSPQTRLAYAYDLRLFFTFLQNEIPGFDQPIISYTIDDLERITLDHLELFSDYLTLYYSKDDIIRENANLGKMRKLSSLRSMFKYFYKKEKLSRNVGELIDLPKRHDRPIIRLDKDETARMLDAAQEGKHLSEKQKAYHEKNKTRDAALIGLLLGTGMRISECIGINLSELDFLNNGCVITRKGGDRTVLYFPEEVADLLREYLADREKITAQEGHEDALFLSMQRKRITSRAVENLVKKYAAYAAPLKHITPHKLRSTFGTSLYRETGDIYLVADVLGHSDVNTTKRHYAAISDDARRKAAQVIRLRDSPEDAE